MGHVFPIIDRKSLINVSDRVGAIPSGGGTGGGTDDRDDGGFKGTIELRNVKFIYPARPSVVVFQYEGGGEDTGAIRVARGGKDC